MMESTPTTITIDIDSASAFVCPFCGSEALAGTTTEGTDTVMHLLPTCPTYERLEPLEYLEAVNRRTGQKG